MSICFLSYPLSTATPSYGLLKNGLRLSSVKSIKAGDSCNVYRIEMENHLGTHIDCPSHFFTNGKKIVDYDAKFWVFSTPQIITVAAANGQLIGVDDLSTTIGVNTDLLIIYSGWGSKRKSIEYCNENPGIHPMVGMWLRKEYPLIRAIGFDWISISSYMHRETGRDAHRVFLDPEKEGHPILIIEDMLLSDDVEDLKQVWVVPFRIEGIDSAPCTAIGVFE